MLSALGIDEVVSRSLLPISGMGGISSRRDTVGKSLRRVSGYVA